VASTTRGSQYPLPCLRNCVARAGPVRLHHERHNRCRGQRLLQPAHVPIGLRLAQVKRSPSVRGNHEPAINATVARLEARPGNTGRKARIRTNRWSRRLRSSCGVVSHGVAAAHRERSQCDPGGFGGPPYRCGACPPGPLNPCVLTLAHSPTTAATPPRRRMRPPR